MSLNPLNELKRRLDDEATPLPKRICLAKNVVQSHHFPAAPKERIVGDWLEELAQKNKLTRTEFSDVISWLNAIDDLTSELKSRLVQVVAEHLQRNLLHDNDVHNITAFLESSRITAQLTLQTNEFLQIIITLLQYLKSEECNCSDKVMLSQRILNILVQRYKDCKKKLDFIVKLLDGEKLETIFDYLNCCRDTVVDVCKNILFSSNKKSFFVSFVQTLLRKDNIDELMAEKGDNIQSVLKIMSIFFTFPKGRTIKDPNFLSNFIEVFVSCFREESQLVFAFYIMVVNSLKMTQSYLTPAMEMPAIIFEDNNEKVKRQLFLRMLEILLRNEVDITVRLTDTFGEKISKVEIKKNFISFLQTVMMGQLKLDGKLDKNTLQMVKVALKLDPTLIEQKMNQILPPIMVAKKNNISIQKSYTEMMNCLVAILFKLSRGTLFVNQILPNLKISLEASNTQQFELKQKVRECTDNGMDNEKLKNKIVNGKDIFSQDCVEMYGKWTSDLLFRQNKELLVSLQKDFEEYCLMMLEEGFISPSIITLTEVLSAILTSFLRHNKMADHTVPRPIAEEFWDAYHKFEKDCLCRFGKCILKLNYDLQLALSFLKLCVSFSQLKLLNWKYSYVKLPFNIHTSLVFDLSPILPCLSSEQWMELAEKVKHDEGALVLDNLLLIKTMAINLQSQQNSNLDVKEAVTETKSYVIQQLSSNPDMLKKTGFANVLFGDLNFTQYKQLAKILLKLVLNNPEIEILKSDAVINNKQLLNALVVELAKQLAKCFENNEHLTKMLSKSDFDITLFANSINVKEYFDNLTLKDNQDGIASYIEIVKQLPVYYLEESYQLIIIFVLLAIKKCCQTKKTKKQIDYVLQILYELSSKYPDVFKIFPVDFLFAFEDKTMINWLTLKIRTSNKFFIIKSILETAVKKVKTDSDIVKTIVELLLTKQKSEDISSIEYFSDPVFQIGCIILPIIAKEKKAITTSAYRSILANLQEKLHESMLECFKNTDFKNSSYYFDTTGNIDESVVAFEGAVVTLNAMAAYSLTLSRYCETTDRNEIKNLDCLWSGLEFFVENAIQSIQNPSTKSQHVDSSTQLLNVILRHIKKLETHAMFKKRDEIYTKIWKSTVARLLIVFSKSDRDRCINEFAVTLKFLCELATVECFAANFVGYFNSELKKPFDISQDQTTFISHKTSKYIWTQCLKANIVGPKCAALSKLLTKMAKNLRTWIQSNYENEEVSRKELRYYINIEDSRKELSNCKIKEDSRKELSHYIIKEESRKDFLSGNDESQELRLVAVNDDICEVLRIDLDTISEAVLAAKKISLDYRSIDSIFELQHLIHFILDRNSPRIRCEISWQSFFALFEGSLGILNSLLMSREELLEDRWPCYMQCYRALVSSLCERATARRQRDRAVDDKLAEKAHTIEKLTQSICKRKVHVSRIAAYVVADICCSLEQNGPSQIVRQHLENSVSLLLQAADSSYAVAFLRRALAGSPGQMTMTNMYTMYKRYHKYVGNA